MPRKAAGIRPRANIWFVWEGEEEAGSSHLEQILDANRDAVHGVVWLICDGPVDQSGKQTVVFGARGDAHVEITVYGPHHGLHSGHYGNWAPNPAMMLAHLLAAMEDQNGHVLIPHFYEGIEPLSAIEKDALACAPKNDKMLMDAFWACRERKQAAAGVHQRTLAEYQRIRIGADRAHAANVVPPAAVADLDLRLVVGIDWRDQQQRIAEMVRAQGFFVVDHEPTKADLTSHPRVARIVFDQSSYNAVRTPMDLPIAQEVIKAVKGARGDVVLLPTMGGSVPLEAMVRAPRTHTITVPIANYDNQHAANEAGPCYTFDTLSKTPVLQHQIPF
jgi:acetylornithine deacetylase/succinyl-diaminopimelate desuccinylase-like protein